MEARESALGAGGPAAPPTSCAGAPPESASPAASMVATESSSGPGATSTCAQPQPQEIRPAEVPFQQGLQTASSESTSPLDALLADLSSTHRRSVQLPSVHFEQQTPCRGSRPAEVPDLQRFPAVRAMSGSGESPDSGGGYSPFVDPRTAQAARCASGAAPSCHVAQRAPAEVRLDRQPPVHAETVEESPGVLAEEGDIA